MRKSILRFGALALMSLMSIGAFAEKGDVFYVNGHKFSVLEEASAGASGEAKLEMVKSGTNVDLSNDITRSETQKYKVTEVAEDACYYVGASTEITLPSVIKIGDHAFANAKVKVTFTSNTFEEESTIGKYAFENATIAGSEGDVDVYDFSQVTLPEGAFYNATFPEDAIIDMGEATSLADYVFGTDPEVNANGINDIQSILFTFPGECLEKVGNYALNGRTGLMHFGYKESTESYMLPAGLKTVGNYAFAGCSNIQEFDFSVVATDARIEEVGICAFKDCLWLTDDRFNNSLRSFKGLTYGEGSFEGCNLIRVDLTGWNPIDVTIGEGGEELKGIPANAFAGNPITELIYPVASEGNKLEAIGDGAFNGSELQNVEFPEGLVYVGNSAFAKATVQDSPQEALYLPSTLKSIGKYALQNREITNVYAHPSVTSYNDIPELVLPEQGEGESTLLITNVYVPAGAPVPVADVGTKTWVELYKNAGWSTAETVKYADMKLFGDDAIEDGNYYIEKNGVKYEIAYDAEADNSGCFPATAVEFTSATPEVDGYVQVKNLNAVVGTETKTFALESDEYKYPLVLNVTGFEAGIVGTYEVPGEGDQPEIANITSIKFNPLAVSYLDGAPGTITALGPNTNLTTYTGVPVNICSGNTDLTEVTLGIGIATIGDKAFDGTTNLTSITFPEGLTEVGTNAFADIPAGVGSEEVLAGLTEVTLPYTLEAIGEKAFAAKSITTVNVSFETIPGLPADAFANAVIGEGDEDENHFAATLKVTAGSRAAYTSGGNWKKFFAHTGTFTVTVEGEGDEAEDVEVTVCENEYGKFVFDDDVKAVSITEDQYNEGTPVRVQYNRTFNNTNWQAVSLPFDVPVEDIPDGLQVAELYNIRLNGEGALEAVVWVRLKETDVIMKAFTPYVIKADNAGKKTIELDAEIKAIPDDLTVYAVDCSSTKEKYTLYSNFGETDMFDTKGYYLGSGVFNWSGEADPTILKPYRFYMTRILRSVGEDNPTYLYGEFENPTPYPTTGGEANVKVVVLDDEYEAATYINALNASEAESLNAPMYDVTGRQIVSPVKGQVYIQNGVKKLAK